MEPFKEGQVGVWSAGDYRDIARHIAKAGEVVVEAAGIGSGMRVLDVACGNGNASIPAARAGAQVTGLDLTPKLVELARERAAAEGLDAEFVEGDAEALPFEDDAFDAVISTFGHMFAPRHATAAAEMARVLRPGGTIGLCTWWAQGTVGGLFATIGGFMPPPPDFASPPILWGTEEHVREMFPGASDIAFSRGTIWVEAESGAAWADFFMNNFGPLVIARGELGDDTFGELRTKVIEGWEGANESTDGRLRFGQEYLLSVLRF